MDELRQQLKRQCRRRSNETATVSSAVNSKKTRFSTTAADATTSAASVIYEISDDENTETASETSAIDMLPTLDRAAITISPTTTECRRSARKKVIKFDVRDLLNKNRKAHKIQIEARIDSNPPQTPQMPQPTIPLPSPSPQSSSTCISTNQAIISTLPVAATSVTFPTLTKQKTNFELDVIESSNPVPVAVINTVTVMNRQQRLSTATRKNLVTKTFGGAATQNEVVCRNVAIRRRGRPPKHLNQLSTVTNKDEPQSNSSPSPITINDSSNSPAEEEVVARNDGLIAQCKSLRIPVKRLSSYHQKEIKNLTIVTFRQDLQQSTSEVPSTSKSRSRSRSQDKQQQHHQLFALNKVGGRITTRSRQHHRSILGTRKLNRTLEEEFAEINAISSKEVLIELKTPERRKILKRRNTANILMPYRNDEKPKKSIGGGVTKFPKVKIRRLSIPATLNLNPNNHATTNDSESSTSFPSSSPTPPLPSSLSSPSPSPTNSHNPSCNLEEENLTKRHAISDKKVRFDFKTTKILERRNTADIIMPFNIDNRFPRVKIRRLSMPTKLIHTGTNDTVVLPLPLKLTLPSSSSSSSSSSPITTSLSPSLSSPSPQEEPQYIEDVIEDNEEVVEVDDIIEEDMLEEKIVSLESSESSNLSIEPPPSLSTTSTPSSEQEIVIISDENTFSQDVVVDVEISNSPTTAIVSQLLDQSTATEQSTSESTSSATASTTSFNNHDDVNKINFTIKYSIMQRRYSDPFGLIPIERSEEIVNESFKNRRQSMFELKEIVYSFQAIQNTEIVDDDDDIIEADMIIEESVEMLGNENDDNDDDIDNDDDNEEKQSSKVNNETQLPNVLPETKSFEQLQTDIIIDKQGDDSVQLPIVRRLSSSSSSSDNNSITHITTPDKEHHQEPQSPRIDHFHLTSDLKSNELPSLKQLLDQPTNTTATNETTISAIPTNNNGDFCNSKNTNIAVENQLQLENSIMSQHSTYEQVDDESIENDQRNQVEVENIIEVISSNSGSGSGSETAVEKHIVSNSEVVESAAKETNQSVGVVEEDLIQANLDKEIPCINFESGSCGASMASSLLLSTSKRKGKKPSTATSENKLKSIRKNKENVEKRQNKRRGSTRKSLKQQLEQAAASERIIMQDESLSQDSESVSQDGGSLSRDGSVAQDGSVSQYGSVSQDGSISLDVSLSHDESVSQDVNLTRNMCESQDLSVSQDESIVQESSVSLDDNVAQYTSVKTSPLLEPNNYQRPTTIQNELQKQDPDPDPLKDIEKFIEDGVNLLKRDYKLGDDDSVDNTEIENTIVREDESSMNLEFDERVRNLETPADSPEPVTIPMSYSPTPCDSFYPIPSPVSTATDDSGVLHPVRRSHRIKQKPQAPKALVGRGVVKDGESSLPTSIDEQLIGLAQIESINEKFLKSEGLNFHMIRENIYKRSRMVSKETADMQCECFLTAEEESNGQFGCGEGCINRMLMIECGSQCSNKERCTNKRFQRQLCSPCRVFRTEKKGCGIVAEVQINPGDFIMEYVGEVIDSDEFSRRKDVYSMDKNLHFYFMSLRGDAIIDATNKGNVSRFINHSCDPNAETQKWTVNGELRIGFFSKKVILPGEEITFDYEYQRYGSSAQPCFCEASNCRGWIGEKPSSDSEDESDTDRESSSEEESSTEGAKKLVTKDRKTPIPLEQEDDDSNSKSKIIKVDSKPAKQVKSKRKPDLDKNRTNLKTDKERGVIKTNKSSSRSSVIRKPKMSRSEKEYNMRFQEDPDVENDVTKLKSVGLKNQANTLQLSRLMVRAKLLPTRLNLLGILQRGELPCRRLFLDYHGLRLLNGWINENGNTIEFRQAMIEALESLPIPNKTMLNDSKIYQTVKSWNNDDITLSPSKSIALTAGGDSQNTTSTTNEQSDPTCNELLQRHIVMLISRWDILPEIFRIPKRERIEQMKVHEREADCPTKADNIENLPVTPLDTTDRYKRNRFGRDTSSRYVKPSATGNGNSISTINSSKESRYSTGGGNPYKHKVRSRVGGSSSPLTPYERNKYLPKEIRRVMFERKVALDDAKKAVTEDRRKFEYYCNYFGLDKNKCNPQQIPFCENLITGEFFNVNGLKVPTPLRCGNPPPAPPMQSTDPAHYDIPQEAKTLPSSWTFKITTDGFIYYINLFEGTTQWEPPSAEQLRIALEAENDVSDDSDDSDVSEIEAMVDIDEDYVVTLDSDGLEEYIKEKINERRQIRYKRLVSVREISPRRDDDRLYNQIESRKYKENKEKIRRRKEIYRRRRLEISGSHSSFINDVGGNNLTSNGNSSHAPLPIHEYLYSSDESAENECNSNSLMDVIVQDDKIVDEIDALNQMKRLQKHSTMSSLPPLNMEPSTSKAAASKLRALPLPPLPLETREIIREPVASASMLLRRQQPEHNEEYFAVRNDEDRVEAKRRRIDREKKRTHISSNAKEMFRNDIAQFVADNLTPYRDDNCQSGRITNDVDYLHLARRLTHYIMTKEVKYCESVGEKLVVNDSVKRKARDYIKGYMQKYGEVYKRPENAPDFREVKLPSTLKQEDKQKKTNENTID